MPAAPAKLRWPAEWEPHEATWLAWPHNAADWPEKFDPIPWAFAEVVRHLAEVERVRILVDERSHLAAMGTLRRLGLETQGTTIDLVPCPTNRIWTRDYAPFFVHRGPTSEAVKWRFNAWAKYDDWQLDDEAGRVIAAATDCPLVEPNSGGAPIVLEGGSIDGNGAGTLLTTEECLLSPVQARNPGLSRTDLEAIFAAHLGVRKVLWLNRGIVGDDTHGHIDDLARFVDPTTVVMAIEEDLADANYEATQENWDRLQGATTAEGRSLRLVKLPLPRPVVFDGQRLPASYANFYIANRLVLVPTFCDPNDRVALNILADLMPDRTVVGVPCRDLVWGLGTIHCMTMQQPAWG
ncbi:MAG TPA: agmatine deiminase family protein [Gemmatales bacterium]|nr:agmatine deiminase family protein [Gemmatales bacterium]